MYTLRLKKRDTIYKKKWVFKNLAFPKNRSYIYNIKIKVMTKQEFQTTYSENPFFATQDVLMRISANLTDMQLQFSDNKEMVEKMNLLKNYIFDYKTVLRIEELNKIRKNREQQIEMDEFNSHLDRY
jgi:hypothetical protein